MTDPNLITTYSFHGRPYLVKMNVLNGCLELILTDKQTGEEWECSYDVLYIENLTRKTGNFKQFEIFITMLKSGLLKTSDCIGLDLLTYDELESMRLRRIRNYSSTRLLGNGNNRKYLILTYSVEFDRINYPLPLEYCGPPDPVVLQATIRRLESELAKANEDLNLRINPSGTKEARLLQKRVDQLTAENIQLNEEVQHLSKIISKSPNDQAYTFQKAIKQIEKNLLSERNSHHKLLEKLQTEKMYLANQLEKLRISERSLKAKLQTVSQSAVRNNYKQTQDRTRSKSSEKTINTVFHRKSSPAARKSSRRVKMSNERLSRSPLPGTVNDNQWQRFPKIRRPSNTRSQSRSRSSSTSSAQQSHRPTSVPFPSNVEITSLESPRYTRKASPFSSASSVKSYIAEVPQRIKCRKGKSSSACSRSASPNVTAELEMTVQKMFRKRRSNQFLVSS